MTTFPKELNRDLLATNIRVWRMMRGFSQSQLAERAGVGVTTVYKAEQGKTVRNNSLRKIIEDGLEGLVEECNSLQRLANVKPVEVTYVHHSAERARWFLYGDQRKLVPEGNPELIQDLNERIRLGRLGFASLFGYGLEYLMPVGPGMLVYEIHGKTDPITQNYRDGILFVLRGSVAVTIEESKLTLREGDSIGFKATLPVAFDLPAPLAEGELPPLVQFIGANRIGKVPV